MSKGIPQHLIKSCQSNNRASQNELYRLLIPYLASVGKRYLSNPSNINDVLQEGFILIFSKLNQFDSQKGTLESWAAKIIINCCFKSNEKTKKGRAQLVELKEINMQTDPEVWDRYSCEEILHFVAQLPESYSQIFQLNIVDGYTHREISELLEISEDLSRKRISRAKAALVKMIEHQEANFKKSIG